MPLLRRVRPARLLYLGLLLPALAAGERAPRPDPAPHSEPSVPPAEAVLNRGRILLYRLSTTASGTLPRSVRVCLPRSYADSTAWTGAIRWCSCCTAGPAVTVFGPEPGATAAREANSPTLLADSLVARGIHPVIYFNCGDRDGEPADNRRLHQRLLQLGIRHTYREFSGRHGWTFWRNHLGDALIACLAGER